MRLQKMQELQTQLQPTVAGSKKPAKIESVEEKKAAHAKELIAQHNIIRTLPFNLIIKTRFNLPEEVIEVKKEPEPVAVDPKKRR